ncbi:MAG: hypothetical protein APR62_05480, partial [Smithella sp. SDB]
MLTPVQIVLSIFFAIILFSIFILFRNNVHTLLEAHYKSLFLIIIISIVSKLPFDFNFFYGLEYEDAYIFTEYSRFLLYNDFFSFDLFQAKGCLVGSIKYCEHVGTYNGHFLGLSSLGYFFNKLFGYSPQVICFINFFASLFSACIIYFFSYHISKDKITSIICSLIYALSPAMSLFHTSGLSETLSSTSIIFTVFLFVLIIENQQRLELSYEAILWLLLLLSISFCLLQKRENLIILFLPLISFLKMLIEKKINSYKIFRITIFMIFGLIILVIFNYGINVFDIESQESQAIAATTFSLKYFISLFPVFIKSFLTFKWFFVFSIFAFVGLILRTIKIKQNPLYIYPILLFVAYLLAYTLHYRSYYFVKYGHINEFDSLRYITNFFPFYCLISGYAIVNIFKTLNKILKLPKYCLPILSIFLIGYLIYENIILKKDYFLIEQKNGIAAVNETIRLVNPINSIIITNRPLIFQVLGKETLQTINLSSIGRSLSIYDIKNKLDKSHKIYF